MTSMLLALSARPSGCLSACVLFVKDVHCVYIHVQAVYVHVRYTSIMY